MEDPRGDLSYCKNCKDNTSSIYTSSSKVICTACNKDKAKYVSPYNLNQNKLK